MYKPMFNKVLVEINDEDAQWGKSSESNALTDVYREGKILASPSAIFPYADTSKIGEVELESIMDTLVGMVDKKIMWHEGHEAGTVFEEDGKKYALIFWWDIIGLKE